MPHRWATGAVPRSRSPHTLRRLAWSAALVAAIQETRADYPMWGKIAVLLQRHGHAVSESTTGRILKTLMERGAVTPVPTPRRSGRRPVPQAIRQTPAQGPQAHYTRRDRPTRHPLATPEPARHQAVHHP